MSDEPKVTVVVVDAKRILMYHHAYVKPSGDVTWPILEYHYRETITDEWVYKFVKLRPDEWVKVIELVQTDATETELHTKGNR